MGGLHHTCLDSSFLTDQILILGRLMELLDAERKLLFISQPVCLRSVCVYQLLFLLLKRLRAIITIWSERILKKADRRAQHLRLSRLKPLRWTEDVVLQQRASGANLVCCSAGFRVWPAADLSPTA